MDNLKHLNPSKITKNGYYFDMDSTTMFPLTDEEILALRQYFNDSSIASNRVISKNRLSINQPRKANGRYKIAVNQKYNDGKHRKTNQNKLTQGILRTVLVGGIVFSVTVFGSFLLLTSNNSDISDIDLSYQVIKDAASFTDLQYQVSLEELETKGISITDTVISNVENVSSDNSLKVSTITDENYERREWVRKYCDIYQVNFELTYNRLLEITNNFTSNDYLNGHIAGVTCKGQEVFASSEEELLLYYVRCVKQLPQQLGISETNLYVNNGYESSDSYVSMISYYNNLLGTDPILSYAITQAETSWNSDLFINSNNPAGLRLNGNWWCFSTKEEGFIELALEILKYNRKGAYTIEEIGSIHAPASDNNEDWIPNVTEAYASVLDNRELLNLLQGQKQSDFVR